MSGESGGCGEQHVRQEDPLQSSTTVAGTSTGTGEETPLDSEISLPSAIDILMRRNNTRTRTYSEPSEQEELNKSKRKLETSPSSRPADKRSKICPPSLEKLASLIEALARQIKEQINVKKETKNSMDNVMEYTKALIVHEKEMALQREISLLPQKEKDISLMRNKIHRVKGMEEMNILLTEKWAEEVFQKTTVGECTMTEDMYINSILVHPESFKEDKNFKRHCESTPALKDVTEQFLKENKLIKISRQETVSIPGLTGSNRCIHSLVYASVLSDQNSLDSSDIWNWADSLRIFADSSKLTSVAIQPPDDAHLGRIRKIFECRFSLTDINVIIVPNERISNNHAKSGHGGIIIEGCGESFAEVIKKLRENVDVSGCGATVERVEQLRGGAARISLTETEKGGGERFQKKIEEFIPTDCKVKSGARLTALVIKDIGEEVEAEEILNLFHLEFGIDRNQMHVNNFKRRNRGVKDVTIFVPAGRAREILNTKRIRLGWNSCRIIERVQAPFCEKCQTIGHIARGCTKEVVPKRCRNCGGQDHLVVACTNGAHCFTCGSDGHRFNSMGCPRYREIVRELKNA